MSATLSATTPAPMRDYQDQGVAWIVRQLRDHRAVLLGDEAGLGKTRQALTAAAQLDADNILVICPAGARRVWQQEIQRWLPEWSDRVILVEPEVPPEEIELRLIDTKPLILVAGYDELSNSRSNLAAWLQLRDWDILVCDEAHYLKNLSNRTKAIYGHRGTGAGIQGKAARVLLLTGTPTPNHAGEIYQHYRTLWPEALGDKVLTQDQFEERFCRYQDTVYGRQVTGSKNQDRLRQALSPFILRRRKDEVLAELPPLVLQDIPLRYWPPLQQREPRIAMLTQATDAELLPLLRYPDGPLATLRRELGVLKVPPTVAWVHEQMASVEKLLIFAWHHTVIEQLFRGLAEFDPVVITGATTPSARHEAIANFQNHPGTRVFIGQILAAGTAITLTAASQVAIVEPSWVPGENYQAICRAHRMGQRDSVLSSFLYLPGTLDERIMRVFRRKAGEIAELQGESEYV